LSPYKKNYFLPVGARPEVESETVVLHWIQVMLEEDRTKQTQKKILEDKNVYLKEVIVFFIDLHRYH